MKVAIFSAHEFEKPYLDRACNKKYTLEFLPARLTLETASLANGCEAVSIFVNDDGSAPVLNALKKNGVRFLLLRSAGFNHVDVEEAHKLEIRVARVADYSPYAVAEHTVALMLAMNRKLIQAHKRVMEQDFSLDGLVGFDMHGKTVGILGTGKIGAVVAKIMNGFGCRILAWDNVENEELKSTFDVTYTNFDMLCAHADIITLHVPLTPQTKYLINESSILKMKKNVMLINTSRGGLVDTKDIIKALKSGRVGSLGLDVYEEEAPLFFEDHSDDILQDDMIARLMTLKNVLITSHQGFLTETALINIAETTFKSLSNFESGIGDQNELMPE